MTNAESNYASAAEIEECAALWVQRRHFWAWTSEDQIALDAWLAQSSAHRVAYVRLDAALRRTKRLAALQSAQKRRAGGPAGWPLAGKIAAAFAITTLVGTGFFLLQKPDTPGRTTYSTPKGGRQTIAFADGSRIELNTDTVLHVALNVRERRAWLDKGEAYFQIQHNAARPFIVIAGTHKIIDLGTKFLLRRYPARLEVALLEGSVKLDAESGTKSSSTYLRPGDAAIVTATKIAITHKSTNEIVAKLGWRRGIVTFDQTSLAAAVAEFNRYNDHKLVVTDPKAARVTIGGTFDVNNIDTFIDIAKEDFGLHAETHGNKTVISK